MIARRLLPVLLGLVTLAACGGAVEPSPTPGTQTPDPPTGGRGGGSTGGGRGGSGGAGGTTPTPQCEAYPTCKTGFVQVKGCIPDAECMTETLCGATIICMRDQPQCDGLPNCDPGDTQVPTQADCPQDTSCYKRETCGVTIWCTGN